jgi:DNA-binding XRE family transcriptional regulator
MVVVCIRLPGVSLKDTRAGAAAFRALSPLRRSPLGLRVSYPIGMRIAELLRAWRYYEGMTVRQAADCIDMASSTYARVEKGYPVSGETLALSLRWMLG